MKFFLFWLLLCQIAFGKERSIAVLVRPDFLGELSFAYRIKAACQNLGWQAEVIEIKKAKQLKEKQCDFVINLVPATYKRPKCKNYMAIFHPSHHYFQPDGSLKRKYRHYDGYLLTYSPGIDDLNFKGDRLPYMKWYPTVQGREYKKVDFSHLFHICCGWGNRFEERKFQQFLSLLDQESFTRFYGGPLFQTLYPRSYQSPLPYEDESLYERAAQAGVTLVLHSSDHNVCGLPSGRIFEAAAASTLIICDENAFVREHFGDSVLYINTDASAESIYKQVKAHMHWIQSNPAAALAKAKKVYDIYQKHFLLEDQLLRLGKFHDRLSKNRFWKWLKSTLFCFKRALHPIAVLPNIDSQYSLINSVDFHPKKNLFCATYTHNNKILFYEIDSYHQPHFLQSLQNPSAQLSEPQHAVFSPDGERLVVANWTNQTLAVYQCGTTGLFCEKPIAVIPSPPSLQRCKPHGIAFSPCGKYLAVAYGAADYYERAIALFQTQGANFECIHFLKELPGTPKGIAFSPDGTYLLVTFCDRLALFPIENRTISPIPKQTVQGDISRPEDVKLSPDGRYCALSNSNQDTVTFYRFDAKSNSLEKTPCSILKNPKAELCFPHGIAFSPDGAYLAITQFGPIHMTEQGDIGWESEMKSSKAKINLYLVHRKTR